MLQALWKKEETCIRVTVKPGTTKIDRGKKNGMEKGIREQTLQESKNNSSSRL